jgi:DNA recombination protein RmuC
MRGDPHDCAPKTPTGRALVTAVLWCLVSAVVAGGLVYWQMESRRAALGKQLEAAQRDQAVAESRLVDLTRQHAGLGHELQLEREARRAVDREREQANGQWQVALTQRTGAERALAESEAERDGLAGERQALQQQVTRLSSDFAALESVNRHLRDELERQKHWIDERTAQFEQKVLAAATKLMEERGKAFTELNKKEVDAVVAPFKEELEKFRKRVDDIHTADTAARGRLDERIVSLTSLNKSVSEQAERLVKALTVSSKSSGDWGETILEKILEDSGLRKDRDYKLQQPIKGAKGEDYRPDAILYLPDQRQLVVDSKVSNKAWTEYCAAEDGARRDAALKEHLASLRAHIKGLSAKNYAGSPDLKTVDFVLMFVPVEAALLTALVKDDALYSDAYAQRIILVTPTTLMAVVRMALGLWTFQTRMESVEQIVEVGRKLYEKFVNFAETFVDVGRTIADSHDAFEKAKGQLSTGRGNAVRLAEQLIELGVTPSAGKAMPVDLLPVDREEAG